MNMVAAPTAEEAFEQVAAAIERRIAETQVLLKPFPHLVLDDLFPPRVRQAIDGYWPEAAKFNGSNYMQRGQKPLSLLAAQADGREQQFWHALRQLSRRTARAVRARLNRGLSDKFRPLIGPDWRETLGPDSMQELDALLAQYTGTVDLVPHVDSARIVINSFVYLDDPELPTPEPRRGTMLYRSIGFAWPSNKGIPESVRDAFLREDREIEWRDNRLLAYVNGPWSFHGVPKHDLGSSRRRLLMFGTMLDIPTAERVYDKVLW